MNDSHASEAWGDTMRAEDNILEFKRSIRGYDPADVEKLVATLSSRLEASEVERSEQARLIQKLTRDVAEAQDRVARVKPNFTELGVAFEETLRVAETQARKMVEDAHGESTALIRRAMTETSSAREQLAKQIQAQLTETQNSCDRQRLDADSIAAQVRQEAAETVAKAQNTLARAERSATSLLARTEKDIADRQAEASREAEVIRQETAEMLRLAQEKSVAKEAELRELQHEMEVARSKTQADADAYAQKAYDMADAHVEASAKSAESLAIEAQLLLDRARSSSRAELEEANAHAERVVAQALIRAGSLSQDTDEFLSGIVMDAENHLADARRQQTALEEYLNRMRVIAFDSGSKAAPFHVEFTATSSEEWKYPELSA